MHIVIKERELIIAAIVLVLFGALGYGLYQLGKLEAKPADDTIITTESPAIHSEPEPVVVEEDNQTLLDVVQPEALETGIEATEEAVASVLEDAVEAIALETDAEPETSLATAETTEAEVAVIEPAEETFILNESQQAMIDSKAVETSTDTTEHSPSFIEQMAAFFEQLFDTQPGTTNESSDMAALVAEEEVVAENTTQPTENDVLTDHSSILIDEQAEAMALESETTVENTPADEPLTEESLEVPVVVVEEQPEVMEVVVVEETPPEAITEETVVTDTSEPEEPATVSLEQRVESQVAVEANTETADSVPSEEETHYVSALDQLQNKDAQAKVVPEDVDRHNKVEVAEEANENSNLRAQLTNTVKEMIAMQQRLEALEAKLAEKEAEESKVIATLKSEAKVHQAETRTVVVQAGDNLWKIAARIYGDGLLYPRIQGANPEIIKNPNLIKKGQVLRVPM